MTANPVLIDVTRGRLCESQHRGALAIWSAQSGRTLALGDVTRPIYPRSAVKAMQAIPLIESGAADAFGFTEHHLALACGSHAGANEHVSGVAEMLANAGLDETALACGSHWPLGTDEARALARKGERPGPLHNNCSGKHAGMLASAVHRGLKTAGYEGARHDVQRAVADALASMTDVPHEADAAARDGCSIPVWAVPLDALALAFARFAGAPDMNPERAQSCQRLMAACLAEPYMIAGRGQFCSVLMDCLKGTAFLKGGAEGVYCAALPKRGIGIALKIDDGAKRAAEAAIAAVLKALLPETRRAIGKACDFKLRTWRGRDVGAVATAPALEEALQSLAITD
jgi:L-asparaginase II